LSSRTSDKTAPSPLPKLAAATPTVLPLSAVWATAKGEAKSSALTLHPSHDGREGAESHCCEERKSIGMEEKLLGDLGGVGTVLFENTCRRKLTQLVPNHVLCDENGIENLAVVN
jgi:hypothetical protein